MKKVLTCVILSICFFIFPNFIEQTKALSNTKGDSFPDLPDTNENYIIFSANYGGSGETFLYTFNGNSNTKLTVSTSGSEYDRYLGIINDTDVNVYYKTGTKWQLIKTTKNYSMQLYSNKIYMRNFDLSYNVTDYNNNIKYLNYRDGSVIFTDPQEKQLLDGTTFIVPKVSVEGYDKLYITKNTSQNKIYIKYFKNDTEDFYKTTNDNDLNGTYNISPKADYYHIEYDITKDEWSSGGSNLGMWNNYLNWWEHTISSRLSTITLSEGNELLYTDIKLLSSDKQTTIIDKNNPKPTIIARHSNIGNDTYLSIEFSIFDTNKYKYEYSLYDTKSWTEISNNYFLTKVYEDGTVFVRITNRETGEFVTSYSYLMTNVIKQLPKIEFSIEENTTGTGYLISYWVNTHFTIFNRDKYKYEYSINSSNNFIEIFDDDYAEQTIVDNQLINIFGYRFVNNGYIIVRILDRQTGEYITSKTYNVVHFEDVLADVIFTEQKYCGNFHQGTHYESEDWNICTRLHFKILYYDTSRYDIFYKISENGQWIRTYDETTSIDLYENTRVYVRIYDKTNNSTFERYYDVNSIDPPEVINSPYVEGTFRFDEETNTMLLRLVFINYNPSLYDYKYMIGTSKRENLKLMDGIVKDEDDLYYNRSFSFTYETYIIVEIDDKDGNYIKAYTFQIEFDDYVDNSMTGFIGRINSFFDNFKNTLEYVSNLITMFFNTMPSFIQMVLVVLFIMFLIFIVLRIGGWRQ